jgi:glycosyltransferase involved in cell wall biosynthesis
MRNKKYACREKVLVVMSAYNAARTLDCTFQDIPFDVVDEVLLVDDASMMTL